MSKFKPVKVERGSVKTKGFYFTSYRLPIEVARKIDALATDYGVSFASFSLQAIEHVIADMEPKSKSSLQISTGKGVTSAKGDKKGSEKKSDKKADKPAKKKKGPLSKLAEKAKKTDAAKAKKKKAAPANDTSDDADVVAEEIADSDDVVGDE